MALQAHTHLKLENLAETQHEITAQSTTLLADLKQLTIFEAHPRGGRNPLEICAAFT